MVRCIKLITFEFLTFKQFSAHSTTDGFRVVREKSDNPQAKCEELGGTLATIEADHDIRYSMGSGRHTVAGATRPGRCNVFYRSGKLATNKKCKKDYYICDLSQQVQVRPQPTCDVDTSVSLGGKYAPVFVDTGSIPYTWYEARDYCASFGHNWGLAIINDDEEYNAITQFVTANCYR